MKTFFWAAVILLLPFQHACGQGVRFGDGQPVTSVVPYAGVNLLMVQANVTVNFCTAPANAVPCTNKATTYTSRTLGSSCSTSTQVVLAGTTICVATSDQYGNWGVWAAPGQYEYTYTLSNGTSYGPFPVTMLAVAPTVGLSFLQFNSAVHIPSGNGEFWFFGGDFQESFSGSSYTILKSISPASHGDFLPKYGGITGELVSSRFSDDGSFPYYNLVQLATVTALSSKVDVTTQVNGHSLSSNVTVSKSDVGLGNADNTSDVNKPVSTAQQTALNTKPQVYNSSGVLQNNFKEVWAEGTTGGGGTATITLPFHYSSSSSYWVSVEAEFTSCQLHTVTRLSDNQFVVAFDASLGGCNSAGFMYHVGGN